MRGKVAKELRRFAKEDTPDVPEVAYVTLKSGTVRLSECTKAYYKLLKRIWRLPA